MGLLDFFVRKDPTHDWPASRAVPLRLDVVRGELNGIGFDVPFDALRVLGKPSNAKPVGTQLFAYAPLGLGVALGDAFEVIVFACVFQPDAGGEVDEFPGFAPCRVALHDERGMLLEVTTSTSLGMVEAALGPFKRWETDDGYGASVVAGSVWLRFIFDHAGRLALLEFEPAGDEADEVG